MKRKQFAWLLIAVVAVAALAGLVVLARSYLQRRLTGPNLAADFNKPLVSISSPDPGEAFGIGQEIEVEITAVGQPQLISSLELQIDNVTAEVQSAPQGGRSPFRNVFSFAAGEPGEHVLLAVATDNAGNAAYSVPVRVEVVENSEGETAPYFAPGSSGVILPSGQPLPSVPAAPPSNPEPSAPSAIPWKAPIVNVFAPPSTYEALDPPRVTASAGKCSVMLSIEDQTNFEKGYAVYRNQGGDPGWVRIATLAAMAGDLKSFTDDGPPAGPADVSYYVEAFNDLQTAASEVVMVHLFPDSDCLDTYDGPAGFGLEMTRLTIHEPVQMAYCYRSFDGQTWHRWPSSGFFIPDADGVVDTSGTPLGFFTEDFNGKVLDPNIAISLECWGWQDGGLIPLGKYSGSKIDPSQAQSFKLPIGQIDVDAATYPNLVERPDFEPATLPLYDARVTNDPADCKSHLFGPVDLIEYQGLCTAPLNGYHQGPEGIAPQPYLVWDVHDLTCEAGSGKSSCIPWADWIEWWAKFELGGYSERMYWSIYDSHGPEVYILDPFTQAYKIPPPNRECLTTRAFILNLHVDTIKTFIGPSILAWADCGAFKTMGNQDYHVVQLHFNNLVLNNVHDGVNNHDLELYGRITVMLQCLNDPDTECTYGLATKGGANGYFIVDTINIGSEYGPIKLGNGTYSFSTLPLLNESLTGLASDTITFHVPSWRGRKLRIFPFIHDSDSGWYNSPDQVCIGEIDVGPENSSDYEWWPKQVNTHVGMESSNGSAWCSIDAYLTTLE